MIITGDSIHISVLIAYQSNILQANEAVLLVEGKGLTKVDEYTEIEVTRVSKNGDNLLKVKQKIKVGQLE